MLFRQAYLFGSNDREAFCGREKRMTKKTERDDVFMCDTIKFDVKIIHTRYRISKFLNAGLHITFRDDGNIFVYLGGSENEGSDHEINWTLFC